MTEPVIRRVDSADLPGFSDLRVLAAEEGYRFLDRAEAEWLDGTNRFDRAGEGFFMAHLGEAVVGVAGLNRDPFIPDPSVGRLRRVYVAPNVRNRGIGGHLVTTCLESAAGHFTRVRLRAENPAAARLYEALGFAPVDETDATHSITIR